MKPLKLTIIKWEIYRLFNKLYILGSTRYVIELNRLGTDILLRENIGKKIIYLDARVSM